jgi:cobalamin biosynthesis protein CobT
LNVSAAKIDEETRNKLLANSYVQAASEALGHLGTITPVLPSKVRDLAETVSTLGVAASGGAMSMVDEDDDEDGDDEDECDDDEQEREDEEDLCVVDQDGQDASIMNKEKNEMDVQEVAMNEELFSGEEFLSDAGESH